jgi:hypothetical protein
MSLATLRRASVPCRRIVSLLTTIRENIAYGLSGNGVGREGALGGVAGLEGPRGVAARLGRPSANGDHALGASARTRSRGRWSTRRF